MKIIISPKIADKLKDKHNVTPEEVMQCLVNVEDEPLIDDRLQHRTIPPTQWIIAETNRCRMLKVVFIRKLDGIHIKTAYAPNEDELDIWNQK